MNIQHTKTSAIQEYQYTITVDYPCHPDDLGKVFITFENGKFKKCTFPFSGNYTRKQWAVLAEIEAEICRIELSLK
jgi:hypothetical protein